MDNLVLDVDKHDDILKVVDAAVIRMEGGTDLDLTILDMPQIPEREEGTRSRTTSETVPAEKPVEDSKKEKEETMPAAETASATEEEKKETEKEEEKEKEKTSEKPEAETAAAAPAAEKVPDKPLEMAITPEQEELQRKAKEYQRQQKEQKRRGKRKKSSREKSEYSYESEESESDSGSDSDMEPAPPGLEDEPLPPGTEGQTAGAATNGAADPKADAKPKEGEDKEKKEEEEGKELEAGEEKEVNTKPEEGGAVAEEPPAPPKPRPLHRTNSIFLRNLAPTITKQEVEALCKRYPGFMRVALQDPQPERRFFRRGWATYSKNINIKDICWNLNNIRLRDCELGATLNRELKQRVRPVNGLTVHKTVARNDVKLAARIIQNLDRKWGLWDDSLDEKKDVEKEAMFSFVSKNPVLHNITDYLVEEGSFEEDELLGTSEDDKRDVNNEVVVEREDSLLKVLDRMIMYLRVVHSLDYYSANEYPNEDEMPHRCGIMHARGMAPGPTSKFKHNDVTEYMTNFEGKLKPFLEGSGSISEEDAVRLGKKNPEIEVEKFVQSNTQELAKDKWLCPLSGKKFKGPDFVRKHIFNKHAEKVEEVKKEVAFFNNYLKDPKRPSLPEHPGNRPPPPPREPATPAVGASFPGPSGITSTNTGPGLLGAYNPRNTAMMYGGSMPSFGGPSFSRDGPDFPRRGGGGGRPYGRRSDPRPIIEYRDLDAPDEMDMF